MTSLAVIRHGPTAWNEDKRLQGRANVPLSSNGRTAVATWRLPFDADGFVWTSSPLRRAVDTAEILGARNPVIEARLTETDWGAWEGRRLAELRRELGAAMAENEARGLDFQAPGGESPRQVQARLRPWLGDVAARRQPTLAIAHKGVIRALMALATGWTMTGEPPVKLGRPAVHLFRIVGAGNIQVERLDIALEPGG